MDIGTSRDCGSSSSSHVGGHLGCTYSGCTVVQALLGLYQGLAAQVRALGLRGVVLGTGMGIVIDMGMGMGMVIAVGMGKAC